MEEFKQGNDEFFKTKKIQKLPGFLLSTCDLRDLARFGHQCDVHVICSTRDVQSELPVTTSSNAYRLRHDSTASDNEEKRVRENSGFGTFFLFLILCQNLDVTMRGTHHPCHVVASDGHHLKMMNF